MNKAYRLLLIGYCAVYSFFNNSSHLCEASSWAFLFAGFVLLLNGGDEPAIKSGKGSFDAVRDLA